MQTDPDVHRARSDPVLCPGCARAYAFLASQGIPTPYSDGGLGGSGGDDQQPRPQPPKWKNAACALSVVETAGATVETVVAGVAIVPEVAAAGWVTAEAGEALATGLLEKTIEPHIVPGNTNMGVARTLLPQAGKLFESAFVANAKGENPSLLQHVGSLVPGVNVVMGIVSIHDHCF